MYIPPNGSWLVGARSLFIAAQFAVRFLEAGDSGLTEPQIQKAPLRHMWEKNLAHETYIIHATQPFLDTAINK